MQRARVVEVSRHRRRVFGTGFEPVDVTVPDGAGGDVAIHAVHGGEGPPLLLLHGFPQSHVMWHRIALAGASMNHRSRGGRE